MQLCLHMPSLLDVPEGMHPVLANRLRQVVERALARAAAEFQAPGVSVTVVAESNASPSRVNSLPKPPREAADSARMGQQAMSYRVPSFDGGGALVEQPLVGNKTAEPTVVIGQALEVTTGHDTAELPLEGGDVIVRRPFPKALVARLQGQDYRYVGGEPYVRATNLARALQWGQDPFGGVGFAILQSRDAGGHAPFIVAGMLEALNDEDLGGFDERTGLARRGAHFASPPGYVTVLLVSRQKSSLYDPTPGAAWPAAAIEKVLRSVPARAARVDTETAALLATSLERALGQRGSEAQRDLFAKMDRTLFSAMPWEERSRVLELLITGPLDDRRRTAVLEIIQASRGSAELEAVFAQLRERGLYERLFRDLDNQVYALLRFLGEFRPAETLDWHYLAQLLAESGLPGKPGEQLHELSLLWEGFTSWLSGTIAGVKSLLTEPEKVVQGLGHLAELLWTVHLASTGDPKAQALVTQMVQRAGAVVAAALRGLRFAEELGTPYGEQRGSTRIGHDLLGRLRAMMLFEVLSWFIGIGEIKAISSSLKLEERLALVARALGSLRLLGRSARVASEAERLERVLAALSRLAETSRLGRIAELLPESQLAALEKLSTIVELAPGADLEALRAALKLHNEEALLRSVDELADALAVAGVLEMRLGADAARYAPGLQHLLRFSGLDRVSLVRLLEGISRDRLGEFLHAVTFAGPQHLAAWGANGLRSLAEHAHALAFLREAGGDVLNAIARRTGVLGSGGVSANAWDELERFLTSVERMRSDPQAYQRLLSRLREGDAAAFARVVEAERVEQLTQRLRQGNYRALREEFAEIAEHDPARHARFLADLSQLSDRELAGLEVVARLEVPTVGISDVLAFTDHSELLGLLADVGPHAAEGLDDVLHGILGRNVRKANQVVSGVQGSWGQLYAGRTLLETPYHARVLRFEVPAAHREYDIVAEVASGRLHVEVKTNLAEAASKDLVQMRRDLVNHAGTGYSDLLYLYHPNVAAELPGVRARMLQLFDEPGVAAALRGRGIDPGTARQAFVQRMGALIRIYNL